MKEMRKLSQSDTPLPVEPDPGNRENSREPTRPPFRSRLFAILLLFALIPTVVVTLLFAATANRALSLFSADQAWERVARSAEDAFAAVKPLDMSPEQREAVDRHETEVRASVELAKRFGYVARRTMRLVALAGLVVIVLVAVGASRVAGHLSRQLSRPLDELVGWTGLIRSGKALPERAQRRGAPEFDVLRSGMRTMAAELEDGRRRAVEAERAEALRESARRFAHELKNPLTPIRFAVARLRRDVPPELQESVEVLAEESARLDTMARSFAQFGRMPDGAWSEIDVGELVSRVASSTVPERLTLDLTVHPVPLVTGYHEPLVRAVSNVLINAVEACGDNGTVAVTVDTGRIDKNEAVSISVHDTGVGIKADVLAHIFDPYVTTKPGGTGLGLAIVRQTIEAHGGTISASSDPANGTRISILLPVAHSRGDGAEGTT